MRSAPMSWTASEAMAPLATTGSPGLFWPTAPGARVFNEARPAI